MDVKNIEYEIYEENQIEVNVEFLTGEQYTAIIPINEIKEE